MSAEADLLHVDVMDGHFVPNLTIGPPVVESLRKRTELFLDCHLMVDNPGVLLDDFADAGADGCTVHVELGDPGRSFDAMRALGLRVGLALNPATPFDDGAAVPRPDRPAARDERATPGGAGRRSSRARSTSWSSARRIVDERALPRRARDRRRHQRRHRAPGRGGRRRHPRGRQRHLPRRRPSGRGPSDPGGGVAERILIADDDDDILEAIRVNLELEGYEVYVAHDGNEALDQARRSAPISSCST